MLFDDNFLASVSEDPIGAAEAVCNRVLAEISSKPGWSPYEHQVLLEGYALLQVMREAELLQPLVPDPSPPTGDLEGDCRVLMEYISSFHNAAQAHAKVSDLERLKNKFSQGLKVGFAYEFSQADLNRIQTLINELRNEVAASTLFEEKHQARLLKRLEQLQRELHKRVSDLDRFWGLIGDAGVALGRFGTAAKPFVERISEITEIVWNTQKQTEGLPSTMDMPLLNNDDRGNPSNE